jgi:hypothetical protein
MRNVQDSTDLAGHFKDELIRVWRQALVENAKTIELEGRRHFVNRTSRHRLRQVDFTFDGYEWRGLEQNPETASRWAKMAREGKKVMQFLKGRRYVGVVVDGQVFTYGRDTSPEK